MNETLLSVLIGIFSGLLTTILMWIVVTVFNAKVTPWLRRLVYDGVNVVGDWSCIVYADEQHEVINDSEHAYSECTYVLSINYQAGSVISGSFSQDYKCSSSNLHRHGQYKVKGDMRDGICVISLLPFNASKSACGTLLVTVEEGGNVFKGIHTYKGADNTVTYSEIVLKKRV